MNSAKWLLSFLCATAFTCVAQQPGQLIINARINNGRLVVTPTNAPPQSPNLSTAKSDAMLFRNGDFLYGALESIDAQKVVRWNHPDATPPIEFQSTNIVAVDLHSRPTAAETNVCQIHFTNGDVIEGELISVDQEKVVLQTWYAGKLTFPRKMVQTIIPAMPIRPAIFSGPTGLDGWTSGKSVLAQQEYGQWSYKNGAFYATKAASIARDLKLPDSASIQFDMNWKGTMHVAIALYTDSLQPVSLANKEAEPDFGGFYSLQLNNYYTDIIAIKKRDPLRSLGQLTVPAFSQKTSAHIDLRVSKAKHKIVLIVDGAVAKEWSDTEEFAGAGTAMRFVHQGQGAIKLSNLRVTEWDGQLDEPPSTNALDHKQDLARLRNGDKMLGAIHAIRDGKVFVANGDAKLEFPLSRLKQVEFAGTKSERAKTLPGEVRLFFPHGGSIAFQLEKWDKQGVTGRSANLGEVKFDPSAFARIQFHPATDPTPAP